MRVAAEEAQIFAMSCAPESTPAVRRCGGKVAAALSYRGIQTGFAPLGGSTATPKMRVEAISAPCRAQEGRRERHADRLSRTAERPADGQSPDPPVPYACHICRVAASRILRQALVFGPTHLARASSQASPLRYERSQRTAKYSRARSGQFIQHDLIASTRAGRVRICAPPKLRFMEALKR